MTEGKSVGGKAPSAPFGYSTVLVLLGKWTTIHMTEGKSVRGEAPSPPFGCTVLLLVGKWITIDMTFKVLTANPAPHSVLGHVGGDIHVRRAVGGEVRGAIWCKVWVGLWVDPPQFWSTPQTFRGL